MTGMSRPMPFRFRNLRAATSSVVARRPPAGIPSERERTVKRPLILALALGMSAFVVILLGAAAPSGHARGISLASLNPVQRAHVSGALAAALGSSNAGAKPAGKIAEHAAVAAPACSTMDPGEEG